MRRVKNLLSKWGLYPSNYAFSSGSQLKGGASVFTPDVLNQNLHFYQGYGPKVRVPNAEVEALTFSVAVFLERDLGGRRGGDVRSEGWDTSRMGLTRL